MTCHFIRHISFQIEIVSDKQKTAGGHRPSAVCYPKRFGFKPLNRFQKVSDRSERDETCTCGTCTCTSSSLRCSASSSMLSAFPRNLSVCFDVGIVAPYRSFVKHFFCVLSFFTKVFAHTPIAPVHYSLLIIHHSLFIGGACLPLRSLWGRQVGAAQNSAPHYRVERHARFPPQLRHRATAINASALCECATEKM